MQKYLSRRQWLQGMAGLALLSCSKSETQRSGAPVSLGPVEGISQGDTEYSVYRFLLRRSGNSISALSMLCTHQTCLLAKAESGFRCPCHGSIFSDSGKVLAGPATRSLVWFRLSLSPDKELLVHLSSSEESEWVLKV